MAIGALYQLATSTPLGEFVGSVTSDGAIEAFSYAGLDNLQPSHIRGAAFLLGAVLESEDLGSEERAIIERLVQLSDGLSPEDLGGARDEFVLVGLGLADAAWARVFFHPIWVINKRTFFSDAPSAAELAAITLRRAHAESQEVDSAIDSALGLIEAFVAGDVRDQANELITLYPQLDGEGELGRVVGALSNRITDEHFEIRLDATRALGELFPYLNPGQQAEVITYLELMLGDAAQFVVVIAMRALADIVLYVDRGARSAILEMIENASINADHQHFVYPIQVNILGNRIPYLPLGERRERAEFLLGRLSYPGSRVMIETMNALGRIALYLEEDQYRVIYERMVSLREEGGEISDHATRILEHLPPPS